MIPSALVLGASGHIGNAILRALISGGHPAVGVCRGPAENLAGLPVRHLDAFSAGPSLFEGFEWVFHAAAPYPLNVHHAQITRAADAMARLSETTARAGVKRLLLTGSFLTPPQVARRERLHPYFATKRAIAAAALAGPTPSIEVAAPACLGPYDLKSDTSLPALALAGALPVLPDAPLEVIDVRDLALAQLHLAATGQTGRRHRVPGHHTRLWACISNICARAHVPAPRRLPCAELMWLGLGASSRLGEHFGLRGGPVPAPTFGALSLSLGARTMTEAPSPTLKSWRRRPLDETLADTADWWRRGAL